MDAGLVGECLLGFSAPRGGLPLVGGQCSGFSGLFSAVEHYGMRDIMLEEVLA